MSVALSVREAGGFVGRRALRRRHSRRAIAAAVRRGEIRRPGRDRYVVPEVGDQQALAHEHCAKAGFLRDVRRYAELTMYGWHILRFAWVDVMTRPEWVRWVIETWLAGQEGRELPVQPADSPAVRDRVA